VKIWEHVLTNAFSIPKRSEAITSPTTGDSLTGLVTLSGETVHVPSLYRLPLLFSLKLLWGSIKLILSRPIPIRTRLWDKLKHSILYVSLVMEMVVGEAKKVREDYGNMHGSWRCVRFDRTLGRWRAGRILNYESVVEEFWEKEGAGLRVGEDVLDFGECEV
jgi:hypothetical protein